MIDRTHTRETHVVCTIVLYSYYEQIAAAESALGQGWQAERLRATRGGNCGQGSSSRLVDQYSYDRVT